MPSEIEAVCKLVGDNTELIIQSTALIKTNIDATERSCRFEVQNQSTGEF